MTNEISDRELHVLAGLSGGLHSKDIANRMNLSEQTVRTAIERAARKLGVPNGEQFTGPQVIARAAWSGILGPGATLNRSGTIVYTPQAAVRRSLGLVD